MIKPNESVSGPSQTHMCMRRCSLWLCGAVGRHAGSPPGQRKSALLYCSARPALAETCREKKR